MLSLPANKDGFTAHRDEIMGLNAMRLLALLVSAGMMTASGTQSPEAGHSAALKTAFESRFEETRFQYGWLDVYWEIREGDWSTAGAGVSNQGSGDATLQFRLPVIGDGPIRVEYEAVSDDPGDFSLILGVSNPTEPTRDSVVIGFASSGNRFTQIRVPGRATASTSEVLAIPGKLHRIAVEWTGQELTMEVDGTVALRAPCARDDFKGNHLALYAWNPASFRYFRLATPAGVASIPNGPAKLASRLLEEVAVFNAASAADHPRLYLKRSDETTLRAKIKSDPMLSKALEHVIAVADDTLNEEPVRREMHGRRLRQVSRPCLNRVTHLAFAFRMTGERRYALRAQQEMLAAAGFSDWNPSHFLDVAELTTALAIGYDWLYDELDPGSRATIKDAIIGKGLVPSMRGQLRWIATDNNWNQVCHAGLSLGALAVMEDWPDLAACIVDRAVENLPHAMSEYAPDGAYPEGPMYWEYGTTYNVLLIAALESVLGTDFGLSMAEGFLKTSDYYLHATGPTGLYFNYSDCSPRSGVSPAMYWFAARRNDTALLWREQAALRQFVSVTEGAKQTQNRLFPFLLLWAGTTGAASMPKANHWKGSGTTPVAMHRSGWQNGLEVYVGIKGGSPGANHAHMDIGSFVMEADGVRWALDLGVQSYLSLESKGVGIWSGGQDGQRWDIFRLSNLSHNTLVVDGKKQRVSGHATLISHSDKGPMPNTVVDMTSVYDGQLASAKRGVGLRQDRSVIIQDEIKSLDHDTTIRWGMVTGADVTMRDRHTAILRQEGKHLTLSVLGQADTSLELFETAIPPHDYDEPNPNTRMIGFKFQLPASTETEIIVLLNAGEAEPEPPVFIPLKNW